MGVRCSGDGERVVGDGIGGGEVGEVGIGWW